MQKRITPYQILDFQNNDESCRIMKIQTAWDDEIWDIDLHYNRNEESCYFSLLPFSPEISLLSDELELIQSNREISFQYNDQMWISVLDEQNKIERSRSTTKNGQVLTEADYTYDESGNLIVIDIAFINHDSDLVLELQWESSPGKLQPLIF